MLWVKLGTILRECEQRKLVTRDAVCSVGVFEVQFTETYAY